MGRVPGLFPVGTVSVRGRRTSRSADPVRCKGNGGVRTAPTLGSRCWWWMFGSCPGVVSGTARGRRSSRSAAPVRCKGIWGASGSNLMVSLLVVRHSGGGPPTGRLQGDYASLRWAISSRGAPPPGTTFPPPPTARPPHPAQKGNLPRGDYTGATINRSL